MEDGVCGLVEGTIYVDDSTPLRVKIIDSMFRHKCLA